MPTNPPRCRRLHTDGRQCGSPAVRHEKLCYQHLAATKRPAHTPTLPDPEDLHAVARGLAELLRLVSRELVEDRQAKRLLAILTAAGANLARLHRQQAQARELDLRERGLALAEARLHAQHPASSLRGPSPKESASPAPETGHRTPEIAGSPTFGAVSPRLRWASTEPEPLLTDPVTDPVDDPELGLLAPGPDPEPRQAPRPDPGLSSCGEAAEPASRTTATSKPEQPSRARQAELDAEAAEQIEFDRRERARSEERRQLRQAAYQVMYQNLSPERKLEEDERYAAEIADFFGYTLEEISRLPSTPVLAPNPVPTTGDHPATPLEC